MISPNYFLGGRRRGEPQSADDHVGRRGPLGHLHVFHSGRQARKTPSPALLGRRDGRLHVPDRSLLLPKRQTLRCNLHHLGTVNLPVHILPRVFLRVRTSSVGHPWWNIPKKNLRLRGIYSVYVQLLLGFRSDSILWGHQFCHWQRMGFLFLQRLFICWSDICVLPGTRDEKETYWGNCEGTRKMICMKIMKSFTE